MWDQRLYLGNFALTFLGKILVSYLKVAPSNLLDCNFLQRNKNAQIWDQKCLIWIFLGWNSKTILSRLKSAPSNLSNCKIS